MRAFVMAVGLAVLAGCSVPNPKLEATKAAYEQVHCGMTRNEVYGLLGEPLSMEPPDDSAHCETATWSIPHNSRGRGHWTVRFMNDSVVGINNAYATVNFMR